MTAILLLVALAAAAAAARGARQESLGFVPGPAAGARWSGRWAGAKKSSRSGVITASSVQEPPPEPLFGSGEEDGNVARKRIGAVLSSLVKQGRLPIPGAPLPQPQEPGALEGDEQQQQQRKRWQREGELAATPQSFSLETAVLAAPFAFEAYNDPPRCEGA